MKTPKILVAFIAFILMSQANFSQPKNPQDKGAQNKPTQEIKKKDVVLFINKTNMIIRETAKLVKEKKIFTGFLHKSAKVQKNSIKTFKENKYQEAINHSFISRQLAFKAFEANGGQIPQSWRLTQQEKALVSIEPSPKDLQVTDEDKAKDQEKPEEGIEDVKEL